jgi:hypothetical protein
MPRRRGEAFLRFGRRDFPEGFHLNILYAFFMRFIMF